MKISFIVSEDENLGVEFLSYFLKKHDHHVNLIFNPNQFNKAYARSRILAKIFDWDKINMEELKRQNPDLIGFSCVTATYPWSLSFAKKIKKVLNKPIIFGGVHPSLVPEIVMENKEIDMVCVGEGEEALLELTNSYEQGRFRKDIKSIWFRDGENIIKNSGRTFEKNIDEYRLDRKLFFDKLPSSYRKYAYFITSRGCPYNCTFCGNEQKRKIYADKKNYLRQKSVDQTMLELKELKNQFKTKRILFVDDVLTMNRKWFKEFIEKYKKEIQLPFTCFIHPNRFDEELALLLKEGGCKLVWYGIQSGSEKTRKEILNRHESDKEIIHAAKLCRKYKLKYMVDHIFDIPFDNNIIESIKLYNTIRPYMLNCYNLLYFPTSKIIEHALRANILSEDAIYKINRGQTLAYQTGILSSNSEEVRNNYSKYALLLTCIPVLPAKLIEVIIKNDKLINLFSRLPLILIPVVKVFLNFRVGHGFLPFAVVKTEIFWIQRFIKMYLKRKISFFHKL